MPLNRNYSYNQSIMETPLNDAELKDRKIFEAQFAQRQHFEVAGGTAEVVDITPEKLKDETPIFFAPAWACNIEVYKRAIETLSEQERRVVSLSHPRRGGDLEARSSEEEMEKYPEEELRKAYNILEVLEEKGIDKVDVVAHSEGAINVTIAATLHPEKFRNIVYFAPAGLIGKDKFTRLMKGFAAQEKRAESMEDYPISAGEEETKATAKKYGKPYFWNNPVRSIKEVLNVSNSQIHEMIRNLHEQGIGIIVISPMDDPVFPMAKMAEVAKIDTMDLFAVTRGGHGGIGDQPELFTVEAEEMLSALQWKKDNAVDGVEPDLADYFRTIGYS